MKNIVITAFNDYKDFFNRGLVMIASLHRTSLEAIDEIIIYNLGFDDSRARYLNSLEKVRVVDYPRSETEFADGFFEPSRYAFKCFSLKDSIKYGDRILWLDAGVLVLKNISVIFDIIEKDGIFIVENSPDLLIKNWTHKFCLDYMNVTEKEMNCPQISFNIFGFKRDSDFSFIINNGYELSKIKEVISGDSTIHRHDQSIFSILIRRYNCPTQSYDIFGEYRGIKNENQVLWAHRNQYLSKKGLLRNKSKNCNTIIEFFMIKLSLFKISFFIAIKSVINKILPKNTGVYNIFKRIYLKILR